MSVKRLNDFPNLFSCSVTKATILSTFLSIEDLRVVARQEAEQHRRIEHRAWRLMTHVAATRHLHRKMHIRLAPDYWTLVPSFRILRFFRSLGYRIELILYLFATSGAK